jgi:putative PIN family toxin of toxin-antitoxin system
MRGVADNNMLVSAAILDGVPRQALDKLLLNGTILVSISLLEELAEVLDRKKFDRYLPRKERLNFIRDLLEVAELVRITETINICRDPKDNMLLELAVSGGADCLITGDRDLLVLNPFRGVEIRSPKEFFMESN